MVRVLSENEFKLLEPIMEKWVNRNQKGRKVHPWRPVINSIFWVLTTGAPWWALPQDKRFAHRATAHRWLGQMEAEGFLGEVLERLIELAEMVGGVDPGRLSIDVFFPAEEEEESKLNMDTKGKEPHHIFLLSHQDGH